MSIIVNGRDELLALAGQSLGATAWQEMSFERILTFAEATGDHQWIHVDLERIKKESPFGAPIAHGYFTLALVAGGFFELLEPQGFKLIINYGTGKVRFPNPLKAGDRFRLAMDLAEVKDLGNDWLEGVFQARIEIEGQKKPACVAECLYRFAA